MACEDCNDTNIPTTDDTALECCEIHSTNCVTLAEAVPCLQAGTGMTLTEFFKRLCSNLNKSTVEVVGGDNVTVDVSTTTNLTTYTVNAVIPPAPTKDTFYEEVVSDINITDNPSAPGPDQYFFPVGYETLTYENTTSSPMVVEVHVSYNTDMPVTGTLDNISAENWVDGAIVKTDVSSVDTVEYETLGTTDLEFYLYDTVDGNVVTEFTSEKVLTSPSGNPVKVVMSNRNLPQNRSFFKIVSLEAGEKVSLKFKSKGTSDSRLLKAQILVKEL